jgi:putative sterol carrier protein
VDRRDSRRKDLGRPPAGERAGVAATVRADAATYLRIVNGELSGAEAFSTRQLAVDGDLAQVAKIAQLGLV